MDVRGDSFALQPPGNKVPSNAQESNMNGRPWQKEPWLKSHRSKYIVEIRDECRRLKSTAKSGKYAFRVNKTVFNLV